MGTGKALERLSSMVHKVWGAAYAHSKAGHEVPADVLEVALLGQVPQAVSMELSFS